jgi:ABC-type transporter Mla maintaining outer membrane lipid asymmetry permease subunit MlaE
MEGAGDKIAAYLNESLKTWEPPKFMWRTLYTILLLGLVVKRVFWQRKLNMQQTLHQIARVGPQTLGVSMLTSAFVGMVFTIQFCQEFSKVGLTRVIGGLLGLAFTRELTPVICAIVLAGRVGRVGTFHSRYFAVKTHSVDDSQYDPFNQSNDTRECQP